MTRLASKNGRKKKERKSKSATSLHQGSDLFAHLLHFFTEMTLLASKKGGKEKRSNLAKFLKIFANILGKF